MDKNLKIFLFSFLASLPLWWGVNVSENKLEGFFLSQIIGDNPQAATAQINTHLIESLTAIQEPEQTLEIKAKSAISIKFDSQGKKEILFKMNEKEKLPIASLTKLATALTSLDIYSAEQKLKVTKEAVGQPGEKGKLRPDETISVNELLNMALIESSNDAAYALSEGRTFENEYLSNQKEFTELMNSKIKEIGLQNTQFFNSTGLDNDNGFNNYSTANDLAKLAYHISEEQPILFEISNKTEYQALDGLGNPHHLAQNINKLIGKIPNVIGGKTGYTEKSGGCIILVLEANGSCIVNVILGAESQETRFEEMEKLINWVDQTCSI
ncbi:D-alanyl-D-alanine carboxypeptidase [Candidatus Parcubacteria bacterium]|nr:D-alanyl-D-alanine carboxypeptidase [Candidatus Parcubacteria bacterium]